MGLEINPERYRAFIALTACTILQFLTDGILKSFGLFYVELLEEFQESVTFTTLITGLMYGVFCLTSLPVMMYLIKVVKPGTVLIIGSVITAFGYIISSLAPNIYFLFLTLSLTVGIGIAFIFPPSILALGIHFANYRATANGIAISGCCLGGLLCPPLYQYLLNTYGLRGALLLTGAILLHNLPMACLLRFTERKSRMEKCEDSDISYTCESHYTDEETNYGNDQNLKLKQFKPDVNRLFINENAFGGSHPLLTKYNGICEKSGEPKVLSAQKHVDMFSSTRSLDENKLNIPSIYFYGSSNLFLGMSTTDIQNIDENDEVEKEQPTKHVTVTRSSVCKLMSNMSFISFLIANSLSNIVAATFVYFLPLHAKQHSISSNEIVILVSLTGAMDLIGRILCGILADQSQFKTYQILALSQLICCVTYNLNQLLTSFEGLIVFCIFIGLFSGMYMPLKHSMMVEIVGLADYPTALAITTGSQLPVIILGPVVFGLLRDATGNYIASYHLLGSLAFFASILFSMGPLLQRLFKKTSMKQENDTFIEKSIMT